MHFSELNDPKNLVKIGEVLLDSEEIGGKMKEIVFEMRDLGKLRELI